MHLTRSIIDGAALRGVSLQEPAAVNQSLIPLIVVKCVVLSARAPPEAAIISL